jgi:hypothetical protein
MPLHYAHRLGLDMLGLIDFDSRDVSTKEQLEKKIWVTYASTLKEPDSTAIQNFLHQCSALATQ